MLFTKKTNCEESGSKEIWHYTQYDIILYMKMEFFFQKLVFI